MSFTIPLNILLLIGIVAANLLSFYHLKTHHHHPPPQQSPLVPDSLLHQLHSIRSSINRLTNHHPSSSPSSDLLLYSQISTIASACHNHPNLLHNYMNYTPFSLCPNDTHLQESLILHGCHPLPRRRCFSLTTTTTTTTTTLNSSFIISNFNSDKLMKYSSPLDLPIPQFMQLARSANQSIRLGLDVGGGTAEFGAIMKRLHNVTVLTTTMNVHAPHNNEAVAGKGLVPLHVPLQQRLPVFDGVLDLVRCGRAVNRWIPTAAMEFLLYDSDRVLRGGGYLWLDRFYCKKVDLDKVYKGMIGKLGYKTVKWAVVNKTDGGGGGGGSRRGGGDVYLTALLQKPVAR